MIQFGAPEIRHEVMCRQIGGEVCRTLLFAWNIYNTMLLRSLLITVSTRWIQRPELQTSAYGLRTDELVMTFGHGDHGLRPLGAQDQMLHRGEEIQHSI